MVFFSATSQSWDVVSVGRRLKVRFPSLHVLPVLCWFPPGSPASSHGLQTCNWGEFGKSNAWLRSSPVRGVTLPSPFTTSANPRWLWVQVLAVDGWIDLADDRDLISVIGPVGDRIPAYSCRTARANARPTTCAPITMICARYLAWKERTRETVSGTKMTRGLSSSRLDALRRDFSRIVEAKYANDETSSDAISWRSFFIHMTTLKAWISSHILVDLITTQLHMFYT